MRGMTQKGARGKLKGRKSEGENVQRGRKDRKGAGKVRRQTQSFCTVSVQKWRIVSDSSLWTLEIGDVRDGGV